MPIREAAWAFGAPFTTGILAADAVTEEHVKLVILVVGTIAGVVGAITWLRSEIRTQIEDHTKDDVMRHRAVLAEIQHIRELLKLKLVEAAEDEPEEG